MTCYLLDATIISHAVKRSPPEALVQWMAEQVI
jgi:predicted nucleic acid-binding protein